jgi:hypothetical protein
MLQNAGTCHMGHAWVKGFGGCKLAPESRASEQKGITSDAQYGGAGGIRHPLERASIYKGF